MAKNITIKTEPYVWYNCDEKKPEYEDYNRGYVLVAYENSTVMKGGCNTLRGNWMYEDIHGKALYWTHYPKHPAPDLIVKKV